MMPFPQDYVFIFSYVNMFTTKVDTKTISSGDFKMYSQTYGLWFTHKSGKYGIKIHYEENTITLVDLKAPYGQKKTYIIGELCRK